MEIPPGIVYLARRLHHVVLPPVLVYIGTRAWAVVFTRSFPGWVKTPAYILSIPVALACSILYKDLRDRRQAAIRGAVLAPKVKSSWIGGIDILLSLTRGFGKSWIGTCIVMRSLIPTLYFCLPCLTNDLSGSPFDKYCEVYGPVVNMRFLFENRVGALLTLPTVH